MDQQIFNQAESILVRAMTFIQNYNYEQKKSNAKEQQQQQQIYGYPAIQAQQQQQQKHEEMLRQKRLEKSWMECCRIFRHLPRDRNGKLHPHADTFLNNFLRRYNFLDIVTQSISQYNDDGEDPSEWLICSLVLLSMESNIRSSQIATHGQLLEDLIDLLSETDDSNLKTGIVMIFQQIVLQCSNAVPLAILDVILDIYWNAPMVPYALQIIETCKPFLETSEEYRQIAVQRLRDEQMVVEDDEHYGQVGKLLCSLIGENPCFLITDEQRLETISSSNSVLIANC